MRLILAFRTIANDDVLADKEKVRRIKKALNLETSRSIESICKQFSGLSVDSSLHELQEGKSLHLQNRLSPVLKAVNLQAQQQKSSLMEAIDYFRSKDDITPQAPVAFLDEIERKALYREDGAFRVSLYKVFLNCIICWNYLYLSHKLRQMNDDTERKDQLLSVMSTHSIMTWAHINMLGEYDFSEEKRKDSVGILPPKMAA